MLYPELLAQADNRLEDFTANEQGELTERQQDRLRRIISPVSMDESKIEARIARTKLLRPFTLIPFVIFLGITLLYIGDDSEAGRFMTVSCGLIWALLFGFLSVYNLIDEFLQRWKLKQFYINQAQIDASLQNSLDVDIEAHIQRAEGMLLLEDGRGKQHNRIQIGSHSFQVGGDLWQQLRESDGQVIAYYLDTPEYGKLLLSIQNASEIDQTQLSEVAGIGADGEIIYQDELSDDVPVDDLGPLKKSSEA